MSKKKLMVIVAAVLVLGGGVAGGAFWYLGKQAKAAEGDAGHKSEKHEEKKDEKKGPAKYVTLDKVIVMLRRAPNDGESHYLSTDLVLTTTVKQEKEAKEHLPLLRSIVVKTLSGYGMEKASSMTVDDLSKEIGTAFDEAYEKEKMEKPFTDVMIGKLIIE
jgi:flagellar FliL protein